MNILPPVLTGCDFIVLYSQGSRPGLYAAARIRGLPELPRVTLLQRYKFKNDGYNLFHAAA